jgi:hypothetical protein
MHHLGEGTAVGFADRLKLTIGGVTDAEEIAER